MLILLPVLAFLLFWLIFMGLDRGEGHTLDGWRGAFLRASIVWAGLVVLFSEGLSLIQALHVTGLALGWFFALCLAVVLGLRRGWLRLGWARLRASFRVPGLMDTLLMAGIGVILILLLLIAWIAPPNNIDSFLYHMPRVVHWAQNKSLTHYVTHYEHQLHKPIWAETAILNLRVLWGNDRPANLVQWFSMLGSVIGVSGIAALLGAGRRGQILAAAFALSVPGAILQSTSAHNDLTSAYWTVCAAYMVVLSSITDLRKRDILLLSLATGVGALTKGHFFVYAPPFLAWYFLGRLIKVGFSRTFAESVVLLAIASVVNFGFWARNIQTYGGPYGSPANLMRNLGIDETLTSVKPELDRYKDNRTESLGDGGLQAMVSVGPRDGGVLHWWAVRMAQVMGRNFVFSIGLINAGLQGILRLFPNVFDQQYLDWMAIAAWSHEDFAGNPVHLLFAPITLMAMALRKSCRSRKRLWAYAFVALLGYALDPIIIGHGPSVWGIRYQIPFFILWAPIAGASLDAESRPHLSRALGFGFLILSIPWVLMNNLRPIIGSPPWPTKIDSILEVSRQEILFASSPGEFDDFTSPAEELVSRGCTRIALLPRSMFPEYPLWWVLDAPQSGIEIRTIADKPHLLRYRVEDFEPCAIFCTACDGSEKYDGFEHVGKFDSVHLFMKP